jgi:chain length determinant protein tyrosine kinase EpsG
MNVTHDGTRETTMNAPLIKEFQAAAKVAMPLASVPVPRDRTIGAILLDSGLLRPGDVEQILAHQRKTRMRFGDAAIALGLVTDRDLRAALAYQFDYPVVVPGSSSISREVIAAYDARNPVLDEIRTLRDQILLRWLTAEDRTNRVVAVVSPEHGEGRTFIAANLAVTFSQMGQRALLVDADMRRPRLHRLFGIENHAGLSAMLSSRHVPHTLQRIEGLRDLSVIPVGGQPPNPQDLLSRDAFRDLLEAFSRTYDVIVIDAPAALHSPEASIIAARAKGCLVVARERRTRFSSIAELGRELRELGATVIGSVYSRA